MVIEAMDTNEVGKGEKHIKKGKEAQGKNWEIIHLWGREELKKNT